MKKIRRLNDKILCSRCDKYKNPDDFCKSSWKKRQYTCNDCLKIYRQGRRGNINRFIDNIYYHQIQKAPVNYTWEQLSQWLITNKYFMDSFDDWKQRDFDRSLTPTVIRKDSKKDYRLDNLMITVAKKAREINVKNMQRSVIQMSSNGMEIARYPNALVAAKFLNILCYSNIHECCKGHRNTCKNFRWKYA